MAQTMTKFLRKNGAAMAGGLAIGVLGSRLLPPVVSMASGSVRNMLGEDPFALLESDHRTILSLAGTLERSDQQSMARCMATFLALKRKLGKHATAEEDVVYPLLKTDADAEEQMRRLYLEHAEMKVHLFQLETAMMDNGQWNERARSLRELLQRHIRDEEETEFPRLRARLDEKRSKMLSGQIRREEAMVL